MKVQEVEPRQAFELLQQDPQAVYLDVRTEEEFARGHVPRALNIPVVFPKGPGQWEPNEKFLAAVEALLDKGQRIVVGCAMGGRSRRACEIMMEAGFERVVNLRGGFSGQRDHSGQIVAQGWCDAGLPVARDGTPYSEILAKLKLA